MAQATMVTNWLPQVTLKISLLLLTIFALSSCSAVNSKNTHYYPVKQYSPRENSLGFSISPPPGDHWYEKLKNNSLIYLKKYQPENYAIYTQATEIHLDSPISAEKELVAYVMESKNIDTAPERYKNLKSRYHTAKSPSRQCVSYENNFEDHGVKNLKKDSFVIVKSSGLFCLHPDTPNVGIDIYYFEKSISGTNTRSYQNEGKQFIASLNFNTIKL